MARALVDEFKQAGFRLQHFIVDAVTAVASTAADFRAAEEFLDLLPLQERSPVMYTNAMNAATYAGDAVEAFRLWKLAVKHFGDRNDISPAALINVLHCCLTNDYFDGVEAIIEHFHTVIRSSKALDEGIIMRVLEAAARSSPPRFAYAESIFTKFESIVGIKPPQEAFTAMLLIYANGRLLPRAFKFMSKMLPQGYSLHPAVAETVADACSQPIDAVETSEERLENAFAVLDELRLSKLEHPIHVECLNILILAASRVGDLNRAWEVFQELEKFDVKPSTYLSHLKIFGRFFLATDCLFLPVCA
jgi:pentatricopeptide repeat protein